jgi:hypothetical protein
MDKTIETLNKKFGVHFKEKGDGKYTYCLPPQNWIAIDINTGDVDSSHWYGGGNKNGLWEKQPRKEQGLEGFIHNVLSINEQNKNKWQPPY